MGEVCFFLAQLFQLGNVPSETFPSGRGISLFHSAENHMWFPCISDGDLDINCMCVMDFLVSIVFYMFSQRTDQRRQKSSLLVLQL